MATFPWRIHIEIQTSDRRVLEIDHRFLADDLESAREPWSVIRGIMFNMCQETIEKMKEGDDKQPT